MTDLEGYGGGGGPSRLIYNLGHAVFEYIEAKFGKEGIRQFLFSLRKSVIGGGEDAYEEALRMKKDEFDQNFEKYLKDRFKPFRDKERPADYGRDLSPNKEKTKFAEALSIAPSPSGDLIAVVTVNRKDQELDIILVSSKDGSVVRNLTPGFDKDLGFDHLVQMGVDQAANPWMAWSPKGDRLAYFVRTEKERTLIIQNVLTGKIEDRIPMKTVDEPESPAFSPDGRAVAFDALRNAVGDIFAVNLDTKVVTNLTEDPFGDRAPSYSPDGKFLIYTARVSGNEKLFRLELDTKKKTQITFGTQDETGVQFIDNDTIVFGSTATDPAVPLEPEVARNGNILNIWTLDLKTGELKQYTDAVAGNWSPIVLNEGKTNRIAFVSYFKNDYSIRTLERKEPLHTAATADFGAPGPIIDFQAPLQHTLVPDNQRKKGRFEKMFLEGRPPVNVGVTNSGDIFGGTQVSFGDVLGDKQVNFFAASISQYRTLVAVLRRPVAPLPVGAAGLLADAVLLRAAGRLLLRPVVRADPEPRRRDRDADRARRQRVGIYPFSRYRRVELSAGLLQLDEQYNDPDAAGAVAAVPAGALRPVGAPQRHADAARRGVRPGDDGVPRVRSARRQHDAAGVRRVAEDRQPAVAADRRRRRALLPAPRLHRRARDAPPRLQELRRVPRLPVLRRQLASCAATTTCSSPGRTSCFANAELRFPLIEAALTPIGVDRRRPRRVLRRHRRRLVQQPPSTEPVHGRIAAASSSPPTTRRSARCRPATRLDALGQPVVVTNPQTGQQTSC